MFVPWSMDLTDEQWEAIRDSIPEPEQQGTSARGGRPWRDPRDVLNARLPRRSPTRRQLPLQSVVASPVWFHRELPDPLPDFCERRDLVGNPARELRIHWPASAGRPSRVST